MGKTANGDAYQLLGRLRDEEYAALEADILSRGVMVPVEKDRDGHILDGHHRQEIAAKHGLPCPETVRDFPDEAAKKVHVIKLNLCRRHLEGWRWGEWFEQLLEVKGVDCNSGQRNDLTGATLAQVSEEVGVPVDTAKKRLRAARNKRALPKKLQRQVESGAKSLPDAIRENKRAEQKAKLEDITTKEAKTAQGVYDVLVIDPPWPMQKIERDVNQLGRAKDRWKT